MENENKDFQENENNITPEEQVRADIDSKISEAAAEVQDDIDEANGVTAGDSAEVSEDGSEAAQEESGEAVSEESGEAVPPVMFDENGELITAEDDSEEAEVVKEPVKITVRRSSFITSVIAGVLVGAILMFAVYQFPAASKTLPGGSKVAALIEESDGSTVVAKVNGEEITDFDVKYYIYTEAMDYANENGIGESDMEAFDWDKEVDGAKLSDTIRQNALNAAIDEVLTIQKGAENGVTLDEASASQVDMQVNMLTSQYGEDGLALRIRTMGIGSAKQYVKMYKKVMTLQSVQEDMGSNASNYYPEDVSVLNEYRQDGKASVKHILIKDDASGNETAEGEEGAETAEPAEDKQAKAQSILDRVNGGEDFDALMKEFNEDTGEKDAGYTFKSGEMQPEFEEAAFALQMNEVSGLVKTSYGYHIIKRIPGMYELQAYWRASSDSIKIKDSKLNKISVKAVMDDVAAASKQLQEEQSSAK